MEKKKLVVNCGVCDVSSVSDKTLDAYGSICIRAACVISSAAARERMAGRDVELAAAQTIDLPEGVKDVQLKMQNGAFAIRGGQKPARPTILTVNGQLTVEKGAEDSLEGYVAITVNGAAVYPESMSGALAIMSVNGSAESYPDDAVLLKRTFVMDRTFALRASNELYYAADAIVITAPDIDLAAIAAAGARFQTPRAILAERYVRDAIPLLPAEAEIEIVPDGTAYIKDEITLDAGTIQRWGDKLYLRRGLTLNEKSAEALKKLTFLHVRGDVKLPEQLKDAFAALDAEYDQLIIVRGETVSDKVSLTIDRAMLERAQEGLTVSDCVKVKFDSDVPAELIRDRLLLRDCVDVRCTKEQQSAIEQIAEDCVSIRAEGGMMERMRGLFEKQDDDESDNPNAQVINAAYYKL